MNKSQHTAKYWAEKLQLQKHPEGGYFKEIYRSDEKIKAEHLPERYQGDRHHSTSIYFLITSEEFSAFHRIKSDEIWHFYAGSSATIHIIDEKGQLTQIKLGNDFENGEIFQYAIPKGAWFAASVDEPDSFALVGCTVAPGFHFDDFELGKCDELIKMFPENEEVIRRLTR
jgi:predicted cupin superfamily sugar epimerase